MKTYHKSTMWPLIAAVLFSISSLVSFLKHQYTSAMVMIILASVWLVSVYLNRRPFLTLGDGKMILSRGLFKPKEFQLKDLKISKVGKGSVEFLHRGEDKFSILLTVMNRKNAEEFLHDLEKELKKKEKSAGK